MLKNHKSLWPLMFLIIVGVFLASCTSSETRKVNIEHDEIGKEAICAVTGEKFAITDSTPVVEYKGKKYYFCCAGCDTEFIKDPEKYINPQKNEPQDKGSKEEGSTSEILYWTCSMHPEVKADKEGSCPICNMKLIPVYEKETDEGSLYLNDHDIELAGIRMVSIIKRNLYKEIHAVGKIAYDPELVIAQEEYVNALEMMETMKGSGHIGMERAENVVEKSKFKLMLLGMDESEIKRLEQTRQIETSLIIPKNITWVYADVYESDIAWLKIGQKVMVTSVAYPGEEFQGKIRSINPVLDAQNRSVRVRIQLSNTRLKLKPGMFVDTKIHTMYMPPTHGSKADHKTLAIPKESVLDTGTRKVVWVYLGDGGFQPREVKLGPEAVVEGQQTTHYYPVLNGLEENELVVTNGNFLIDSESQLTGIAAIEYGGALGVEEKPPIHTGHQH